MKKIIYSLLMLATVFTACNPLEDVYEELDAQGTEDVIVDDVEYTLSDEDYTKKKEDGGIFEFKFANFSSEEQAKELLPAFLEDKYPVLGKASTAKVTYKLFNKKNDEKSLIVYEVKEEDYTNAGLKYPNISNPDQMLQLLNHLYPTPEYRVLVSLTYTERVSGVNSIVENGFIYANDTWEKSFGITEEEYKAMGEIRPQFSSEEEAFVKIPIFLKERKFKYEPREEGAIEGVMYKLYVEDTQDIDGDGRTDDRALYSFVSFFIYDGVNWVKYNNAINKTLQFGHDGTTWVPDNTIKYTLTLADYALVGNDKFNNFDVREGKPEFEESVRLEKINTILLNNFPQYGEGQKFSVSYNVWKPGNDVFVMNVIHNGTEYVLQ